MSAISARPLFINDSKATNADATARALAVYPDIFWIAGGKPKEGGIESLAAYFPRIRRAYLIGEAAHAFSRTLDGKAPYEMSGTLDVAVVSAARDAAASDAPAPVVLLSPACASYDQFKDFEQRGDAFRAAVGALAAHDIEGGIMSVSRADKGGFASWWFTVDKVALTGMALLIGIGLMLAFAASPAITGGPLSAGDFRYAARQLSYAAVALGIMARRFAASLRQVKITAAVVFAVALIALFPGAVSRRRCAGRAPRTEFRHSQPAALRISQAQLCDPGGGGAGRPRPAVRSPSRSITLLLILPAILILLLQPDVGQTGLLLSLWGAMLFFAGLPLFWVGLLAGVTALLGFGAYRFFPMSITGWRNI